MKKVILIVIILIFGIIGNRLFKKDHKQDIINNTETQTDNTIIPNTKFTCDGRIYCSQMTSCEEAMFFLKNCPNVKMDGNGDGVPCEKQWCK